MAGARLSIFWASLAVCVLGGAYLGFSSCGGYLWHRILIERAGVAFASASFFWPSRFLQPWHRRLLYLPTMFLLFMVVQCLAGAFYPEPPSSLMELWHNFLLNWKFGLC